MKYLTSIIAAAIIVLAGLFAIKPDPVSAPVIRQHKISYTPAVKSSVKSIPQVSEFAELEKKFAHFDLKQLRHHLHDMNENLKPYSWRNFDDFTTDELLKYNEYIRIKSVLLKRIIFLRLNHG